MFFQNKTGFPDPWVSPVSYPAQSIARLLRDSLDKYGWVYERESSEKVYDRMMVLMPLINVAHVHRFVISEPVDVTIDTYDTRPTHSSFMPYLSIHGVEKRDIPVVRKILDDMVASVERPLWEFTLKQRINHGMFMSEFKKARKAWSLFGFESFRKWKPPKDSKGT